MTKSPINRRSFLAGLLAAGGASSAFPTPAIASGKREWRMVMTWQKVLPGLGTGAVRLAERITKLSEGELTVKAYGGGELVPPLGVFDAVSEGKAEMGHTSAYYWLNKAKAAAFFTAVPSGMTAQEQNAWVYFGGGQQLWDELYAPFGLMSFPAGNTGAQMGGWFNRTINTPDDIKGLKIRMPGLAGQVIDELGGSSQTIPPQELYTAMQSGVIDALEWVGPWNDMALGFHKVSKHYYGPGFHEGGAMLECMINKAAYEALPDNLKRIVKMSCALENQVMLAEYQYYNTQSYARMKHELGVDIRVLPDEVQKVLFEASRDVLTQVGAENDVSKRIYESYTAFQKQSSDFAPVSEFGFIRGRDL